MSKLIDLSIHQYYDTKLKAWVVAKDEKVLADAKAYAKELTDNMNEGAVAENAAAIGTLEQTVAGIKTNLEKADTDTNKRIDDVEGDVGNLEDLDTTAKGDLVNAINEVRQAVNAGGTAAAITIDTTTTTSGALKSYTIKQGENTIGTIDIPKDMVVESGEVVTNPSGQAAGTYIKLVLANVTDPLYINVGTLVDIYKAKANATQIQLAIDSSTREISATIVAGSVGTTELADGAVTTVKIADTNVTLAKLSTSVQASLGKADTAVQKVEVGASNGTIKVDGKEVAVAGLKSAAFVESSTFDAAGSAAAVQAKLDEEVERAKAAEAQALADAKTHANNLIGDANSGVTKEINDVKNRVSAEEAKSTNFESRIAAEEAKSTDFESRIKALESVEYATEADIDAWF